MGFFAYLPTWNACYPSAGCQGTRRLAIAQALADKDRVARLKKGVDKDAMAPNEFLSQGWKTWTFSGWWLNQPIWKI